MPKKSSTISILIAAAIAAVGVAGSADALLSVSANITTDTTWGDDLGDCPSGPNCEAEVLLQQPIFVKNGATLTILPGVIVRGQPRAANALPGQVQGTPGTLIVTQSGRVVADGSATNPIIMTTAAVDNDGDGVADDEDANNNPDPYPGFVPGSCATSCVVETSPVFLDATPGTAPLAPLDGAGNANVSLWGGLAILGSAPTNLANTCGEGYGTCTVEGLTVPGFPAADALYGGVDPHDNSGVYRFISVRHAGDEIGSGNELNGITLAGVGDATVLEYLEVYCNDDDGFEWFGGTANGSHLFVAFAGDDQFDLDQGYTGINQFLFSIMPFFTTGSGGSFGTRGGDKAAEWDGDDFAEGTPENVNIREEYAGVEFDLTPWPLAFPSMYNLTAIGSAPGGSPDFAPTRTNSGKVQMRNGFAGALFNSVIVNTGSTAPIDVTDGDGATPGSDTCTDLVGLGLVKVVASSFSGSSGLPLAGCSGAAIANGDAENATTDDDNVQSGFAGLQNADVTFDPQGSGGVLVPALKSAPIDPRPVGTTGVDGGVATGPDRDATYRGAFPKSGSELWTDGWTALSIAGLL